MSKLNIGDQVMWRGGWGREDAKVTAVTSIEINCDGGKYGDEAKSVEWSNVDDNVVVGLKNGHWAYGSQLREMPQLPVCPICRKQMNSDAETRLLHEGINVHYACDLWAVNLGIDREFVAVRGRRGVYRKGDTLIFKGVDVANYWDWRNTRTRSNFQVMGYSHDFMAA